MTKVGDTRNKGKLCAELSDSPPVKLQSSITVYLAVGHLIYPRAWFAFGLLMLLTLITLSVINIPEPVGQIMLHDKAMHLLAYGGITGWFAQIFRHSVTRVVLLLLFIAIGVAVELVQGLVPSRQFEVLDMVANASGAMLAWALVHTRLGNLLPWFERCWQRRAS